MDEFKKLLEAVTQKKGSCRIGMDVTDEMEDLFKVYSDSEAHLRSKKERTLQELIYDMKIFIDHYDEHAKVSIKLTNLKNKLENSRPAPEEEDKE